MTILNTKTVYECNYELVIRLFFISIIVFLFAEVINSLIDDRFYTNAVIVCGVILLISCIVSIFLTKEYARYNRYEVKLDNTYSANELYSNYNVVEKNGEIWVIEDKEKKINVK